MKKVKLNSIFILFILSLSSIASYGQTGLPLTLSEIMFNSPASSSNSEFVEIYNTSTTETIDLAGYKIKYSTNTPEVITNAGFGTSLAPGKFAVVFENDYDLAAGVYAGTIPADALILKITDNAFGSSGMANTTDRNVQLLNTTDQLLDEYTYTTSGNGAGVSDEKILLNKDNSVTNWANTTVTNGTPGANNSESPKIYDLSVSTITHSPLTPFAGDDVDVTAKIKNVGTAAAANYTVNFYNDQNDDGAGQAGELFDTQSLTNLAASDSASLTATLANVANGIYKIIITVDFALDENLTNNKGTHNFAVAPAPNQPNDIIINEMMHTPGGDEPEWIELYNRTNAPINLKNWKITDNTTTTTISTVPLWIPANDFIVLSDNATITNYYTIPVQVVVVNLPSLNNAGDNITLKDSLDQSIENVTYLSSWGGSNGNSLERKLVDGLSNDPANWGTCTAPEGGTPGLENSIVPKDYDLAITSLTINPTNPAAGSDVVLTTKVKNIGQLDAGNYSVEIFNDANGDNIGQPGERIDIQNFTSLAVNDSNLVATNINDVTTGTYSIISQVNFAQDEDLSNNISFIDFYVSPPPNQYNDIVINEIMYGPAGDEPEWIELYNRTGSPINLKNWKVTDGTTTTTISSAVLWIPANDFIVLSEDASISNFYTIPVQVISINLPSLNNTGDNLSLKDSLDQVIDNVNYLSAWGGSGGNSLERISVDDASNDPGNWGTSIALESATPGLENSLVPNDYDLAISRMSINPAIPLNGSDVALSTVIKNLGELAAGNYSVEIFNDTNDDNVGQLSERIDVQNFSSLAVADSNVVTTIIQDVVTGTYSIIAVINYAQDEYLANNTAFFDFNVPPNPNQYNDIVINEIMYGPTGDEPEWIELYNRTAAPINLKGWEITDGTTTTTISSAPLWIPANDFIVLSDDASISNFYTIPVQVVAINLPSLNNTNDNISLKDSLDQVIDNVNYLSSWGGGGGNSLERILVDGSGNDSGNWGTSIAPEGATPGLENSLVPNDYDLAVSRMFINPVVPAIGSDVTLTTVVKNIGQLAAGNYSVEIFNDANGDNVGQLSERINIQNYPSLPIADSNLVITIIQGVVTGSYSIIAVINYAQDENTANNTGFLDFNVPPPPNQFDDIVINEIMYAPSTGEPEWIELFNRTDEQINLKGWRINDNSSSSAISTVPVFLPAHGYIVIADEATVSTFYNIPSQVIVVDIPSLNNTGDDIKLLDSLLTAIDSVNYLSSWGGNSGGKSLERKEVNNPSNDSENWGSCEAPEKATPGKENSLTPKNYDLAVIGMGASPVPIYEGQIVSVETLVENKGLSEVGSYFIQIFDDANGDLTGQMNERIAVKEFRDLPSGATTSTIINVQGLALGTHTIIGNVYFENDMNHINDNDYLELTVLPKPENYNDVVINEIMYDPKTNEPEWIEIYNNSGETINLKNWRVRDLSSSAVISTTDYFFLPNTFLVLADNIDVTNFYTIPSDVVVLNLPSLNNDADNVIIRNPANRDIDSVAYLGAWGGGNGKSLERIYINDNSNDSQNWGTAKNDLGGTPGAENSVVPKQRDLEVSYANYSPLYPIEGDDVNINIIVKNIGLNKALYYVVKLFHDTNNDAIGQVEEQIFSGDYSNLSSGDSISVPFKMENLAAGEIKLIASVVFQDDEAAGNNNFAFDFDVFPKPEEYNSIVINEIMYSPDGDEPEWIEIYNRSEKTIDLNGWKLADATTKSTMTQSPFPILPGQYVVLADNETITNYYQIDAPILIFNLPSLNNGGDDIALLDSFERIIDEVPYKPSWGGDDGISLERILFDFPSADSSNWGSCVDINGATPGKVNSIIPKEFDLAVTDFYATQEIAVVGNVVPFIAIVKNSGQKTLNNSVFKVFYDINKDDIAQNEELIYTQNVAELNANAEINFDFDVANYGIGINKYIAVIENVNDVYLLNNTAFTEFTGIENPGEPADLLVNEFMYAPKSGEPEWIEIFYRGNGTVNRSSSAIELSELKIADRTSVSTLSFDPITLQPGEYFIIAKDSSIFDFYQITTPVVVSSFPSLNNTGDRILILDFMDRELDSLNYLSSWGGSNGKSLERKNVNGPSDDVANWAESTNPAGATPGSKNSVSSKDYNLTVEEIIFDPAFPNPGDNVSVSVKIKNNGALGATTLINISEDINLDGIAETLLETSGSVTIQSAETYIHKFNYTIPGIQIEHGYAIDILFEADEDKSDNKLYATIAPGNGISAVVINEIMYDPENDEPEWIELFNNSDRTVNLKNWTVSDLLSTPRKTTIVKSNLYVSPHGYLVLSADSTIMQHHLSIPSDVVVVSFASLNNSGDGVILIDEKNLTIDSVSFVTDWGGENGFSLERKNIAGLSNDPANWGSATDPERSTPGRMNSISPKQNDLSIQSISVNPAYPVVGDNIFVTVVVKNSGLITAAGFSLKIFYEPTPGIVELLSEFSNAILASGESKIFVTDKSFVLNQATLISAQIIFGLDENISNNSAELNVVPGFPKNAVLINEFMYDPFAGGSEWIEFVNNTAGDINIKGWYVSDLLSSPTKNVICTNDVIIGAGKYFVVASDTGAFKKHFPHEIVLFDVNFGTLGNTSDGIMIIDPRNAVIDSLKYSDDWGGGDGYSLERIFSDVLSTDSTNWYPSLNIKGATPGEINSVQGLSDYDNLDVIVNEIMFDPDGSNSEFVEFYNKTDKFIEIGGWTIEDEAGNIYPLSKSKMEIAPHQYFVLAADSSLLLNYDWLAENKNISFVNESSLGLTNSGEQILVRDFWGNVIDSLKYSDGWHNRNINITKNRSLERIAPRLLSTDPANWSSCVDGKGATPGKQNSIYTDVLLNNARISVNPNPFSPDNDGFEDFTIIRYNLTQNTAQVRLKVFDSRGRLVRTVMNNQASGSSGSIIFDGRSDDGNPLRIGIYILFIEALNSSTGVVDTIKEAVVVARKL
ncbi:MAG: lamin tail domain-containing protein [bacterium]